MPDATYVGAGMPRDLRDQHNSETRKDCESGCDTHRTCREDRGPCTHGLTAGRGTAERCLECGEAVGEPRPENPYRTVHARMSPPGAAWDEGFAAGRAAATPDPPDDWTAAILTLRRAMCTPAGREQVERELIRPFAASPDERLREALRVMIDVFDRHDRWCGHYADAPGDGIIHKVPAARAALAADREAPDEEEVR